MRRFTVPLGRRAHPVGDQVKRAGVPALAVTLALGITSCTPSTNGPLRFTDSGTVWCQSTRLDGSIGIPIDRENGPPIEVTAVRTLEQTGVTTHEVLLVPVSPYSRTGSVSWPLTEEWGDPRSAIGRSVPAGEHFDLAIHLARDKGTSGTTGTIFIDYEAEGRAYTANTYTQVKMEPDCRR